jgi:hypothetical protein
MRSRLHQSVLLVVVLVLVLVLVLAVATSSSIPTRGAFIIRSRPRR